MADTVVTTPVVIVPTELATTPVVIISAELATSSSDSIPEKSGVVPVTAESDDDSEAPDANDSTSITSAGSTPVVVTCGWKTNGTVCGAVTNGRKFCRQHGAAAKEKAARARDRSVMSRKTPAPEFSQARQAIVALVTNPSLDDEAVYILLREKIATLNISQPIRQASAAVNLYIAPSTELEEKTCVWRTATGVCGKPLKVSKTFKGKSVCETCKSLRPAKSN
jgi:hypothetical protein